MYVIMSLEIAKGFQIALSEKVSQLASASGMTPCMTRIFKLCVCRRGTAASEVRIRPRVLEIRGGYEHATFNFKV